LAQPADTARTIARMDRDRPGVMIAVMETMMQLVKSQPDFEARRLARKSAVKFRY